MVYFRFQSKDEQDSHAPKPISACEAHKTSLRRMHNQALVGLSYNAESKVTNLFIGVSEENVIFRI